MAHRIKPMIENKLYALLYQGVKHIEYNNRMHRIPIHYIPIHYEASYKDSFEALISPIRGNSSKTKVQITINIL